MSDNIEREAARIAEGLTEARKKWLLSLPVTLTTWEWSERFSRRVVDYCVNQGLSTWFIADKAHHDITPLGLAVRNALTGANNAE